MLSPPPMPPLMVLLFILGLNLGLNLPEVLTLTENATLAPASPVAPLAVTISPSTISSPLTTDSVNLTASVGSLEQNPNAANSKSSTSSSSSSSGNSSISLPIGSVTSTATSTNLEQLEMAPSVPAVHTSVGNGSVESLVPPPPPHEIIGSASPTKVEQEAILRALDWLKEKRASDYGWGNDTHVVILAKELSGGRDPNDSADAHMQVIQELEDTLSVKEMEIEILSMLDRHHTLPKPLNLDKLARYVLALGSLCKDPKHFHGHDLVATLQHHEPVQDIEFALTTLSACSSAAHVRKRQIRRLLDIASGVTDQSVDAIAMVILALRCIVTDHRHRHLQHFVRRPARGLASLQDQRGSFGSLRSTALAMQALQDLEYDPAGHWNRTAASRYILSRQRADGGWSEEPLQDGQEPDIGVGLTADIVLALGWKGLGAVRALQCDHVIRESSDPTENGEPKLAVPFGLSSSAEESDAKNISYTYTLWVGSNVTEDFSLSLVSPKNTSFFKAMTQAAEMDPRFTFEAREWPNGHYVHTLYGKKEEPQRYHYWLLYRLPELPDANNTPGNQLIAPVGVDELMVEDGEHYLYWYKKL
ncbi:uncharacterized protein Dwil_GK15758 [Drosophila willistoni]|uniref:Uncharacterized protein n=1 Tax=Drosophila willistoni TaxID=7260 RepID=B4NQ93_DROWI|nr:uncharacterized protein Dwil_GK15758 [Drosophila willistoni]